MNGKKTYKLNCPECADIENETNGNTLSRHKRDGIEDFYRCSKCHNEWFDSEIIKTEYKTILFKDHKGNEKFIPLTPLKLAEWKRRGAGCYSKEFVESKFKKGGPNPSRGWRDRRDSKLLRRLRK
jgi:hypothetical protein|tara:strand:+ start:150 stop:524 length:375 start_codon:yes stop_codon:yes gene_type:complete